MSGFPSLPDSTVAEPAAYATRLLVLGLGNDVLSDDAVGLHVSREVARRCAGSPGVVVRESMEMGFALLDEIAGAEHLILVDAIITGDAPAGTIHEFDAQQLTVGRTCGPHFVGIGETLALGRLLGIAMPRTVRIFAIEVLDAFTIGTQLTPAVADAVGVAAERIVKVAGCERGDDAGVEG